jgi:hypothetical protein
MPAKPSNNATRGASIDTRTGGQPGGVIDAVAHDPGMGFEIWVEDDRGASARSQPVSRVHGVAQGPRYSIAHATSLFLPSLQVLSHQSPLHFPVQRVAADPGALSRPRMRPSRATRGVHRAYAVASLRAASDARFVALWKASGTMRL